jgi:predicted nucleic acid-binding protein
VPGQEWQNWSEQALAEAAELKPLIVNPITYAEVPIGFAEIEVLEAALPSALYQREPLPWEAAFLAGKCFVRYRRRGGLRTSPLPDFYIGLHAAIRRYAILTRDAARYRSYFPAVDVLTPGKQHAG